MKLFSSLHDPKHEKYAIYYSVVLIIVIISITLLVNGLFEISPIEGTMMFFEGFVALFMLSRHEKVSHSFSGHIKKFEEKMKNTKKEISKSAERMINFTSKIPSQLKSIPKLG
jgi:hypothetical protein